METGSSYLAPARGRKNIKNHICLGAAFWLSSIAKRWYRNGVAVARWADTGRPTRPVTTHGSPLRYPFRSLPSMGSQNLRFAWFLINGASRSTNINHEHFGRRRSNLGPNRPKNRIVSYISTRCWRMNLSKKGHGRKKVYLTGRIVGSGFWSRFWNAHNRRSRRGYLCLYFGKRRFCAARFYSAPS